MCSIRKRRLELRVDAAEDPARAQHAAGLGEERVLECPRGDVVEHREADDGREPAVREGQPRCRRRARSSTRPRNSASQARRGGLVHLDRRQSRHLRRPARPSSRRSPGRSRARRRRGRRRRGSRASARPPSRPSRRNCRGDGASGSSARSTTIPRPGRGGNAVPATTNAGPVRGRARRSSKVAEDTGFEPVRVLPQHDFQSCALGHSANPPRESLQGGAAVSDGVAGGRGSPTPPESSARPAAR